MNLLMFPRMLTSHGEGWDWLMRVHPSVSRTFLFYVVPMSLLPPAMLFFASHAYPGDPMLGNITGHEALVLGALFYLAELIMVPLMARVVQRIGRMADAHPAYHDAFAFAAAAPTPLWLSTLFLAIPSRAVNALAMVIALILSAVLIYEGSERIFNITDESRLPLLTGSVLAAGLVAWAALSGLALAAWGSMVAA